MAKENEQVRATHILETTKAGAGKDGKSKQVSDRYSQTGGHREGQVRIVKESEQASEGHSQTGNHKGRDRLRQ